MINIFIGNTISISLDDESRCSLAGTQFKTKQNLYGLTQHINY